jgi:uncharacterized membrane protein
MPADWQSHLDRWIEAGLLDADAAERIRAFESTRTRSQGLRWPVLLALVCGAVLVGAGALLFVSAHWDELSPAQRMTIVLLLVACFHAGGAAVARRFEALSIAMHTVGTISLGAGIALAGQIFNISEHWPAAILLWAIGAALGWLLLRHWTQAALTAILGPAWLVSEWVTGHTGSHESLPVAAGICALSFTYLSARRTTQDSALRKALAWIGGLALLPTAALTSADSWVGSPFPSSQLPAWALAIALPMGIAWILRGRDIIFNAAAVFWTLVLAALAGSRPEYLAVYGWCAVGSVGLSMWGIRDARPERINLGIAAFACTVFAFYFSSVMDKIGRSASLMGLGVLFLGGGWALERTRRRLIARIRPEAS